MAYELPKWAEGSRFGLVLTMSELQRPKDLELASLARQAIEEAKSFGFGPPLQLPKESPWGHWPEQKIWAQCNVNFTTLEFHCLVNSNPWVPPWLGCTSLDPFSDSFKKNPENTPSARVDDKVISDPAVHRLFDCYRTYGQREAIRAALGQPEGTTLTINLPTGTGKTYAVIGPALAHKGVTVVVVPTTTLAIEQERRLQEILDGKSSQQKFAYHGTMTESEKQVFRQELSNGEKKIIFTSPEALMTGLSSTVRRLGGQGQLRALVIDEAHIIDEWGFGFRSEFQLLSGFRRAIIEEQRLKRIPLLRTMLLTGTLTNQSLKTIHALFGCYGDHEVIGSMGTRPEISYWKSDDSDSDLRRIRLIETLSNAAKPCIVYVTRVSQDTQVDPTENVSNLSAFIKQQGFSRVAAIDGNTSYEDKKKVINGLSPPPNTSPELDIVVANSAFGLGIDIEGLRTVIHACVPETIERLYQEAGRAGRDGRYATHILLPVKNDWILAKSMAEKRILKKETARSRWEAMNRTKINLANNEFDLDLTARHRSFNFGATRRNMEWNQRTLTLMHLANLITLGFSDPPKEQDYETESELTIAYARYKTRVRVKINDLTEEGWNRFEEVRSYQRDSVRNSIKSIEEIENGLNQCINEKFADVFTINEFPEGIINSATIRSDVGCAGCPFCRRNGVAKRKYVPTRIPASQLLSSPADVKKIHLILFDPMNEDLSDYFSQYIPKLVAFGYLNILIPQDSSFWEYVNPNSWLWDLDKHSGKPEVTINFCNGEDIFLEGLPARPTLVILWNEQTKTVEDLLAYGIANAICTIVIAPNTLLIEDGRDLITRKTHFDFHNFNDIDELRIPNGSI